LYIQLPILSYYLLYTTVGDAIGVAWYLNGWASWWGFFFCECLIGYIWEYCVAYEGRKLMLGLRGSPPFAISRWTALVACSALTTTFCALAGTIHYSNAKAPLNVFLRMELANGVLRSAVFAVLLILLCVACGRRMASIHARLVIYLALYFDLALLCQFLHERVAIVDAPFNYYERIEVLRISGWILVMAWSTRHIWRMTPITRTKRLLNRRLAGAVIGRAGGS
jgi:hypothetical protein